MCVYMYVLLYTVCIHIDVLMYVVYTVCMCMCAYIYAYCMQRLALCSMFNRLFVNPLSVNCNIFSHQSLSYLIALLEII